MRLSAAEAQSVTGWAAQKEVRGDSEELAGAMEHLRIYWESNATFTALGKKKTNGFRNGPEVEPLDTGATNASPDQKKISRKDRGRHVWRTPALRNFRGRTNRRMCFFCSK